MHKYITITLYFIVIAWVGQATATQRDDFNEMLLEEAGSVSEAVEIIKSALMRKGFTIVGVVDHAKNAETVGTMLRPTQVILFRDDQLERKLIRRAQTVAIDLPQKILVYEDEIQAIRLVYNGPGYLADRHRIEMRDNSLARIAKTLNPFGNLDNGLVTIDSVLSVDDTIDMLKAALKTNGFFIPFVIDFNATESPRFAGMRPTRLIIFGNPNVGTQILQNQQEMGLDLPQKFLVWEDRRGQTHVTFNDIFFLAKRHGVQGIDTLLKNIANVLATLAESGTGQ